MNHASVEFLVYQLFVDLVGLCANTLPLLGPCFTTYPLVPFAFISTSLLAPNSAFTLALRLLSSARFLNK